MSKVLIFMEKYLSSRFVPVFVII